MYVKWSHLILLVIVLFILFYLWVEVGGRHGKPPAFEPSNTAPVQGTKSN